MYGPPPDPRQVLAPVEVLDDPWSYLGCIVLGALFTAAAFWRRPRVELRALAFIVGQVVLLTAPLAWHLDRYVYGAFPTIDKEGSLLFYLDGVHRRQLLDPVLSVGDSAVRLIGVHTGHLWVVELFDLLLSPIGAFNAQALFLLVLGWFAGWLLLRDLSGDSRVAMLLSFPFGMGLHVFRDLNWYTIEKAGVGWLALFAWAAHRAWRDGGWWRLGAGALLGLTAWMNLYLGMVGGALLALAILAEGWRMLRTQRLRAGFNRALKTLGLGFLFLAPLLLWQSVVMQSGPALASPDEFLWQRAALDGFSLVPFRWNRLEVHRALNLVAVGLAVFAVVRSWGDGRIRFGLFAGLALFALSIGPVLLPGPVENPVYMLARAVVPGFWRVAKPEVFFHASWLLMLGMAAVQLQRAAPQRGGLGLLYALFVGGWLLMVRTHPVYPAMTLPQQSELSEGWQDRVFGPGKEKSPR